MHSTLRAARADWGGGDVVLEMAAGQVVELAEHLRRPKDAVAEAARFGPDRVVCVPPGRTHTSPRATVDGLEEPEAWLHL